MTTALTVTNKPRHIPVISIVTDIDQLPTLKRIEEERKARQAKMRAAAYREPIKAEPEKPKQNLSITFQQNNLEVVSLTKELEKLQQERRRAEELRVEIQKTCAHLDKLEEEFGVSKIGNLMRAIELIVLVRYQPFGVGRRDLYGTCRAHSLSMARFELWWLGHEKLGKSLSWVGRRYGRDHTTIRHGVIRYNEWQACPPEKLPRRVHRELLLDPDISISDLLDGVEGGSKSGKLLTDWGGFMT